MISRSTMAGGFAAASILMGPVYAYAEEEKQTWRLFVADHTAPVVCSFDAATGEEIGSYISRLDAIVVLDITGRDGSPKVTRRG